MSILGRVWVFGLVFLVGHAWAGAEVSERQYRMRGELVWEFGTNVMRYPVEAARDGEVFKLSFVTQPEVTNYHELAYLSAPGVAVSFSQYTKDIAAERSPNGSWNNGQVSVSNHRMPQAAMLVPIWLMLNAGEVLSASSNRFRPSLFSDGPGMTLHERPLVIAAASADRRWAAGFSRYAERFTTSERKVRETTFAIESWTNCNGVLFPRSCVGTCSDWNVRYEFVATEIEELKGTIDERVPVRSVVTDWRPMEEKRARTGLFYDVTNGMVLDDVVLEEKKGRVKTGMALDWAQSHPMPVGTVAPDFRVKDLDGAVFRLSEMRGRYVLLNFWSTTCGPCIAEMPELKEAHAAFGDRVVMLGLALDENERAVRRLVKEKGMQWRQVILKNGFQSDIARKYKVDGIPTTYLIGPDGRIVADINGGLEERLRAALGEKSE